jgi:hypothetical protein
MRKKAGKHALLRTNLVLVCKTEPRPAFAESVSVGPGRRRCNYDIVSHLPVTVRLHNYAEVRAYLEQEHQDWLRALMPRHINAPADYWPQKVLAVSSANAAMQNYVSICEHQTTPNPALAAVHGRAALFLGHDVQPTTSHGNSWLPHCGPSFRTTWSLRRSRKLDAVNKTQSA